MAATTSLALMGAGAAANTVGSFYSARGEKSNLRFQAELADQNAKIAELGAQSALQQGQREVQRAKLNTAQLKSAQKVAMAANGIELGEGTATQILTSTDIMGEEDANTIEVNAARNAWGYRTQKMNYENQAAMGRATASAISPGMNAGTSLLSNAGAVANQWYTLKQAGAFAEDKKSDKTSKGWW